MVAVITDQLLGVLEKASDLRHELRCLHTVEHPVVQELSFDELPIIFFTLRGGTNLFRLRRIAADLRPALEAVPGVRRVEIFGGLEREVKVDVDQFQEKVEILREQLETTLHNWREQFTPGVSGPTPVKTQKTAAPKKTSPKKTTAKKTAAKKTTPKATAKKDTPKKTAPKKTTTES